MAIWCVVLETTFTLSVLLPPIPVIGALNSPTLGQPTESVRTATLVQNGLALLQRVFLSVRITMVTLKFRINMTDHIVFTHVRMGIFIR